MYVTFEGSFGLDTTITYGPYDKVQVNDCIIAGHRGADITPLARLSYEDEYWTLFDEEATATIYGAFVVHP